MNWKVFAVFAAIAMALHCENRAKEAEEKVKEAREKFYSAIEEIQRQDASHV